MNSRLLAGIGATLALAATVYVATREPSEDADHDDLRLRGEQIAYNVYRENDDYVVPLRDGGKARLTATPCARRPAGVRVSDCMLLLGNDGGTHDQGDENTMQPGTFTGPGCVPTACVVLAGEAPETGPVRLRDGGTRDAGTRDGGSR